MATTWAGVSLKRKSRIHHGDVATAAARAIELLEPRQLLSAVVTTYPVPVDPSNYWSGYDSHIIAGSKGNFWFTDSTNNSIDEVTPDGKVTQFPLPVHNVDDGSGNLSPDYPDPTDLVVGSDGNVWFVESGVDRIGRITPNGVITEFKTPTADSNPTGLALGADGNLWFGETSSNSIGRIAPNGSIREFSLLDYSIGYGDSIAEASDGNIWFLANDSNYNGAIGKITPGGKVSFQPLDGFADSITAGPDGNLWVAAGNSIERVATDGTATTFDLPSDQYNYINSITAGADGNVYFTLSGNSQFGKITPAGVITEYSLPNTNSGSSGGPIPYVGPGVTTDPSGGTAGTTDTTYNYPVSIADLTQASDGRFWFVDSSNAQVGVIDLTNALLVTGANANVTAGSSQTSTVGSFVDLSGSSTVSDYTATLTLSDGTVLNGVIAANSNGGFDVSVTNTWTIGYTNATLTVTDTRNTTRTATTSTNIEATAPQAVGTGVDVTATAGQTFIGTVATFTNVDLNSLTSYSARIDWGDGHSTAGVITANATGGIDVSGSNAYAQSGTFTVSTTLLPYQTGIYYPGGPIGIVPVVQPVAPPMIGIGVDPLPPVTTGTLVGFTRLNGSFVNNNPTSGTANPGVVIGTGGLGIGGSSIRTMPAIFFNGYQSSTASSTATVSAGVAQGTGYSVQASSKTIFNDDVASFTLTDPKADLSHFHATVEYNDPGVGNWWFKLPDNTSSAGVITADDNGGFTVSTTSNFTQPGLFHFVVKISDDRLPTGDTSVVGVAYGQVIVDTPNIWLPIYNASGAPLASLAGRTQPGAATSPASPDPTNPAFAEHVKVAPVAIKTTAGKTFNGNVGTLKGIASTASNLNGLHGTIHWGDGTTSTATFVAQKKGKIAIQGSHVYTNGGTQPVTIDISQTLYNKGQASTLYPLHLPKITSAAKIASPLHHAITTGGLPLTATAGTAFTSDVATFTAPSVDPIVTRTATIFWGDRTHSIATISANGNVLTVTGSHLYKKAGKFKVLVDVTQSTPKGSHVKVAKVLAMIKTTAVVS